MQIQDTSPETTTVMREMKGSTAGQFMANEFSVRFSSDRK